MPQKKIPLERLIALQQEMSVFPTRSVEKKHIIQDFASLYNVSMNTVYRCLRELRRPKALQRSDAGNPRILRKLELDYFCQLIAAMKIRTLNKKGRHLPTTECIRLLEDFGLETPTGFIQAPKGLLKKSTVNRYLRKWEYTLKALSVEPGLHFLK